MEKKFLTAGNVNERSKEHNSSQHQPNMSPCTLRDIQKINTGQLCDLNQAREDLEDLCHHEPGNHGQAPNHKR